MGLIIGLSVGIVILTMLVAGLTIVLLLKGPKTEVAEADNTETHVRQPDLDVAIGPPASTDGTDDTPVAAYSPLAAQSNQEETSNTTETSIPAAKPKQEIVEWLSQSKVFGIRISKNSSKVILNNKAFKPGEIVNFDFDLKLLNIDESKLLFVDSDGAEYTKRL